MRSSTSIGPEAIDVHENSTKALRLADGLCAQMAKQLYPYTDKYLNYRLQQSIIKDLTILSQKSQPINLLFNLSSFNFNEHHPLTELLQGRFQVDWGMGLSVAVRIPDIQPLKQLVPVHRISHAVLKIAGLNISSVTGAISSSELHEMNIPYEGIQMLSQKIVLPVSSQKHSISVILGGLQYFKKHNRVISPVVNKRWQPLEVLEAAYFQN